VKKKGQATFFIRKRIALGSGLANGKKNFIATDYAWGQALPSRKDIFRTLAPMAFPRIRPDP